MERVRRHARKCGFFDAREGAKMDTRRRDVAGEAESRDAGRAAESRSGPSADQRERRILDRLQREVGQDGFNRYFEHQTKVRVDGNAIRVTVPTGYVAEVIGKRFGDSIRKAASEELGSTSVDVSYRVDGAAFGTPGRAAPLRPVRPAAPVDLAPRYTLDEFEVGEPNRLAFAAALKLTEPDCPRSASPLFIHGPCGVGKTHLLRGVAQRMRDAGVAGVVYTTAEAFTNEYVMAVRTDKVDAFRRRYRGVKLLCVDDVQFLQNKSGTQTELLHTFDAIDLGGARIVLASDEHPRRVQKLSESLVSRFMAGMVVRIEPPDAALRSRIVSRLAHQRGLTLDSAGASLIAARCGSGGATPTVRDIEGVLTRIEALLALPGASRPGPIGLVLIRRALGLPEGDSPGAPPARPVRPVRMARVIEEVCRVLRVEATELYGKGRHKRVVLARSVCATLGRSLTTMSYPEIARALGRPNHSTVITAVQRLQKQMEANVDLNDFIGTDATGLAEELAGLTLRTLADQIRHDILRAGS